MGTTELPPTITVTSVTESGTEKTTYRKVSSDAEKAALETDTGKRVAIAAETVAQHILASLTEAEMELVRKRLVGAVDKNLNQILDSSTFVATIEHNVASIVVRMIDAGDLQARVQLVLDRLLTAPDLDTLVRSTLDGWMIRLMEAMENSAYSSLSNAMATAASEAVSRHMQNRTKARRNW